MMHPPVSPGSSVLVNGGKAVTTESEHASIDAIPQHSPGGKSSDRPRESVGNRIDDKNCSVGKIGTKDSGALIDGGLNGRAPPRSSPATISDLRPPWTDAKTGDKPGPGSSTSGFIPLPLTSPTEPIDLESEIACDIIAMAAKSSTESQSAINNKKGEAKKPDQSNGSKTNLPSPGAPIKPQEAGPDQDSNTKPAASLESILPNGAPSALSPNMSNGAPYIEDSDSEDEELQDLLTQKRDQIRRDIAHYQKTKEMELLIYEKRLRDDHMRRKRRKQAVANGHPVTSGSPRSHYSLTTKNVIGNLPGYLPLTPTLGNNAPAKPSGLRKTVDDKVDTHSQQPEDAAKETQHTPGLSKVPSKPEQGVVLEEEQRAGMQKPDIVVKPPSDTGKPLKSSPAMSPVTASPGTPLLPPSPLAPTATGLSASALKALEGNEKHTVPLPGSLKSTSSWASGSTKESRRSSVNDHKAKKNKRVVFQLEVEGDWFRVKPDGEEVPMEPEERARLRAESAALDADYDSDSESDYLEFKVPSSKESLKKPALDAGHHAIDQLGGIEQSAAAKPSKGPEDPDWAPTKPLTEPTPAISSAKSTISEDSLEDDVFGFDEELPYDPQTAPPEFTSGSLEDSVMSLGLPLAPPPPPPPSAPGLPIPPSFGIGRTGGSVADTLAYIQAYQQAGISRGSSASGSYLSSSFPRNSFGGSGNSWRDAAAPPRPSSSHGSSTVPSAPANVARRASGGLDLVTAPTLETLSSSVSGNVVGQAGAPLSSSLASISGFKRRTVSKYDIPDEDVKDISASSSVTSKSDLAPETGLSMKAIPPAPPVNSAAAQKTPSMRTSSSVGPASSPYGTSAPISIPPRHAPVAPPTEEPIVAPEQVQDDVPKEVVSGRPSPTSSSTTEKSNQPTAVKARTEAQKKSIISPTSVKEVLEATTEALSKNALPSSMSSKSKREHKGSRSGSSTPKYGSYNKKSPSSRARKIDGSPVKPEPWHDTIVQSFPAELGNKSFALDAAQAVSSPSWNSYNSISALSTSLPKYASGSSAYSFATNPITALPGVKSYSPTAPMISHSNSPRKGPITLSPGPRYSSAVAEEAAARVEAKGLPSESVVGRPGLRGIVESGTVTGNGLLLTDAGAESVKETLLAKEPGSLSLSQRLALEEAGEPVGALVKK
ncbi:hypothetical protein DRE_00291 [Drechslerella stenobrocha 248]|uniref:Uncharacterized protein n=1 Tax=Drechslerella stenobrocha 248 TaxID=1043628 RepID=W7I561_9PEZI|nr:hypothetical protein DRE_00291 [Drechslerella stenobrocha 248]